MSNTLRINIKPLSKNKFENISWKKKDSSQKHYKMSWKYKNKRREIQALHLEFDNWIL